MWAGIAEDFLWEVGAGVWFHLLHWEYILFLDAVHGNNLVKEILPSLLDISSATHPTENWQPESTQAKEPESTIQPSSSLSCSVCQKKIPTPRTGAYGKTVREAVGIFIAGYVYKPPLRGQVTVFLTTTLIHLQFSKHAWFPTVSKSPKFQS